MPFEVTFGSRKAVYEQVADWVRFRILSGEWGPGKKVIPIRTLAADLGINPTSVDRGYQVLEKEGLLVKRGTIGTFVSDSLSPERVPTGTSGSWPTGS